MPKNDTTDEPNFGTYELDGDARVAQSLDHAIELEWRGWAKTADAVGGVVGTDTRAIASKASKSSGSSATGTGTSSGSSTS